jgi:8-amino-7-oxononanoate synthase
LRGCGKSNEPVLNPALWQFYQAMKADFLQNKIDERKLQGAFRTLKLTDALIDFCSNDYLGLARRSLASTAHPAHGSTGSRLLSGNSADAIALEERIAVFHEAEAALLFNSGYSANLGLLGAVVRKGDFIVYDQLSHASIRDGIRLGFGQSFAFRHNDMDDLQNKLQQCTGGEIFVVTEAVFSMDGDLGALGPIAELCAQYKAHLIVDEAHALGVIGSRGEGLAQSLQIHQSCFARVYTYGKAAGAHGAAIVGSAVLRDYLINFSRPFIYTTAMPLSALQAIDRAYDLMPSMEAERDLLRVLMQQFQQASMAYERLSSPTPVQGIIVRGNEEARALAGTIQQKGIDVRPILYPTVARGAERLRIVLHAYNTVAELQQLLHCLG